MSDKSPKKAQRVTSAAEVKGNSISKHNALDLMQNAKGSFFTATVIKKDGSLRKINGQYLKDQEPDQLGYVKVRDWAKFRKNPEDCIRNINLQTIQELSIKGRTFKVK